MMLKADFDGLFHRSKVSHFSVTCHILLCRDRNQPADKKATQFCLGLHIFKKTKKHEFLGLFTKISAETPPEKNNI